MFYSDAPSRVTSKFRKFRQRFKFCLAYLGHFGKIWELRNEITKSEERFEDLTDFQNVQTYWLWRFRSRVQARIVDLYLSGEGPREISRAFRVTHSGVCIIRHYQTYAYGTYTPFNQGGRGNPSKLSDNVIKSIELFKLMNPSMFGRQIRERLLNDGGNLPALSMETRE